MLYDLENTFQQINKIFEKNFSRNNFWFNLNQQINSQSSGFKNNDSYYELVINVPDYKSEDIDVELDGNFLKINGKKEFNENGIYSSNSFNQSIQIPNDGLTDNIDVTYNDKTLTIKILKNKELTAPSIKKIEVKKKEL